MGKKLSVLIIIALAVGMIITSWIRTHNNSMSQEQLLSWIKQGYNKQFCNVVFPRISDCVTLKPDECHNIADAAIDSCLNEINATLGATFSEEESKDIYKSVAGCFERNTHDQLMQQYLIHTEECMRRMS